MESLQPNTSPKGWKNPLSGYDMTNLEDWNINESLPPEVVIEINRAMSKEIINEVWVEKQIDILLE
jgi:hypothetical protein